MTERDHTGGAGLTGATGDLTFEENDRPFVTGEAREVSDPGHQADVTAAQIRGAPTTRGETPPSSETSAARRSVATSIPSLSSSRG